ncbi:hypothetical protein X798_07616 [Onchocerca flexuosa]|uniref:Uncharacterized protein n=1 Tax=Onchocerca flexuosa TaxID=387005 RepID=A0A238BJ53_9BILA|nr:hypothetical protein X798_07616 [Onchocerca flexuosa]
MDEHGLAEIETLKKKKNRQYAEITTKATPNNLLKTLSLITLLSLVTVQIVAANNCKWISGISFDILKEWKCEEFINQNVTLHKVEVHIRTHVEITAIKYHTITSLISY